MSEERRTRDIEQDAQMARLLQSVATLTDQVSEITIAQQAAVMRATLKVGSSGAVLVARLFYVSALFVSTRTEQQDGGEQERKES